MKDNNTLSIQMVSIVLPCYNPPEKWCTSLIFSILELNKKLPDYTVQFIISNDGSTRLDKVGIRLLASMPHVLFLDNPVNEGKGSAIRKGTLRAEGDVIIYTDIDFPFGTDPIVEMVEKFEKNPDCWFVYGSRDSDYFRKLPLKRRMISRALQIFNKVLLSKHITDTQAGIKGLRKEILPVVLETKTNTFVFEIELIRKLIKKRIGIDKVEVRARPSIVFTDFSAKVLFREAINFARITIMSSIWNDLS